VEVTEQDLLAGNFQKLNSYALNTWYLWKYS
jgi:hypothetical protein